MSDSNIVFGIGFPSLLTLLFIGLKLSGVIQWPWLWVLSPLWISFVFLIVAMYVLVVFFGWRVL